MNNYRYFSEKEILGLDRELCARLDQARHHANTPFILTSTLRSPERALGVENSAHLTGKAVDIRITDSTARFKIVRGLILAGFTRIGVYDKHAHADIDESKPQEVMWLGESK